MYPLVRDLAGDGIPVTVTCRVLKFSPQAFYAWPSRRSRVRVPASLPTSSRRRHVLSVRRVWTIYSRAQPVPAHGRTRGRWKKPGPPVHDDLVERDLTAPGPNRLWLTDITEHPTGRARSKTCACAGSWATPSVPECPPNSRSTPSTWPPPGVGNLRSPGAWFMPIETASSAPGPT